MTPRRRGEVAPQGPKARTSGLLVRDVGSETVVLVEDRTELHVLDEVTAAVWRACDGIRNEDAITTAVTVTLGRSVEGDVVSGALAELRNSGLLEGWSAGDEPTTRRDLFRRAAVAVAGAAAAPAIVSIVSGRAAAQLPTLPPLPTIPPPTMPPPTSSSTTPPPTMPPPTSPPSTGPPPTMPPPTMPPPGSPPGTDLDQAIQDIIDELQVFGDTFAELINELRGVQNEL